MPTLEQNIEVASVTISPCCLVDCCSGGEYCYQSQPTLRSAFVCQWGARFQYAWLVLRFAGSEWLKSVIRTRSQNFVVQGDRLTRQQQHFL